MMLKTKYIFCFTLFLISILACNKTSNAQLWGAGASILYNPQTESFGAGVRVEIPFNKLRIVPQLSYYPSFNKVTEYYLGVAAHLDFMETRSWKVYAIAMASYNHWINYHSNSKLTGKPNNWDGELGLGWTTHKCLRPFIEYRYNFKWKETNLGIGFVYTFNCKDGKSRSSINCPGR